MILIAISLPPNKKIHKSNSTSQLKIKKRTVKAAKLAASLKNQDEFYHSMISKTKERNMTLKEKLDQNKFGNLNYVRYNMRKLSKEINQLEFECRPNGKHIRFDSEIDETELVPDKNEEITKNSNKRLVELKQQFESLKKAENLLCKK